MKRYRLWRRLTGTAVLTAALTVGAVVTASAAAASWAQDQELSLTLDLNKTSAASSFLVYLVEEWTEDGYQKTAAFGGFGEEVLEDMSASGMVQKAGDLKRYIDENDVAPDFQGTTVSGTVVFDHMKAGVYLVAQNADGANTVTVTEDPYLLMLPMKNESGDGYTYDVVSLPKYTEITEQETTPPYHTADDGTPEVSPENRYDSREELPETVIFDTLLPLGDGFFYNPDDGEAYFIFDESVPLARMGDSSIPSAVLAVVAAVSGAGCIILYRRRREEENDGR